jgi:hypothetical protein
MRRTCTALIALTALLLAVGSTGPSALAIDPGPLTANPDPLNFGSQDLGDTTPAQTVTLTNASGTVPLTITSIGASGDYNVPGASDHCSGTTLNMGDSCNVDVTFQPGSTGPDPGQLTINDDDSTDGVTQQAMNLNGNGVTDQFAVNTPAAFGSQLVNTTSAPQSVTVTNNTDYAANPNNPSIGGSNSGDFNASGCSASVGANATCTVNVTFTPSATGTRNATLNVAGQSVPLSGTGVQAGATLSPGTISFGSQPVNTQSATKTITLMNTGTGTLTYSNMTVGGATPGDFSVGDSNCASTVFLAPNDTCTITVQFVPIAIGHRSATIVVHDNAPSGTQTVNVSGTATASSVGFGPPTVAFAKTIPAGTGSPGHTITVFNETSASMPVTSTVIAGANPKSFIETGDLCSGKTLAPNGGKCTVKVKFTPSSAGRRTALLAINDTGTVLPHLHEITLTGNASFPNNPKSVAGSVGCSTAHVRWVAPSATRFAGTIVIRNHARYPRSVGDGTRVPHTSGLATDTGLRHITTYYYRVFATYHSLTHAGKLNYSQGTRLKERTGQICSPENGARRVGTTPTITWLPAPTKHGYAFVLQRGSDTIDVENTPKTRWHFRSSWRYPKAPNIHRLVAGHTYTFYLYSYPASHPNGFFIGQTTFTVRR